MPVLSELREKRNSHAVEMRTLLENNKEKWSKEHQAKYDEHNDAIAALDTLITNTQRLLDLEAEEKFTDAPRRDPNEPQNQVQEMLARYLRNGRDGLNSQELQAMARANSEFKNTMSTGTGSQGGFTVQNDVAKMVVENMAEFSSLRVPGMATVISTQSGAEMSYPTSDDTAEEGEWVAENQPASQGDPTVGSVGLNTHKLSSKIITLPIELIQDSSIDIVALVISLIARRMGRGSERGYTTGSGTGQPRGFVTASTVGVAAATGSATSITYDQLVDLEHSVNRAYRRNGRFAFNDNTLKFIRKIKDDHGLPIFVPGYQAGVPGGAPDTILNKRYEINDYMADLGASAKPVAFGDFSKYVIRDVMQMLLLRFEDSKYMENGQVAFLAWMRSGGNLIDVNAVKTFQNSAT